MKKYNFKHTIFLLVITFITAFSLNSCYDSDEVDDIDVFRGETMGEYLQATTEFSEFYTLLEKTNISGLLFSYGEYTCFAPTNEAMTTFYKSQNKSSLDDFSEADLKRMAYNHLISGKKVMYVNFVEGRLPWLAMSETYIAINFIENGIFINGVSEISQKDISVHNGVVHKIEEVLNPTRTGIVEEISEKERYSLFYEALAATHLDALLLKEKDDSYDPSLWESMVEATPDKGYWYYEELPLSKKYGYTVFVESNETYANNTIYNLEDLKIYAANIYDELYPDDKEITDLTDRKNSLNRFIAYHLVEKELTYSYLIDAYDTDHMLKTIDMYEYIETLCPNTLIEVKKSRLSSLNYINYVRETTSFNRVSEEYRDMRASNGVFHEMEDILVYSKSVHDELSTKRLRFDSSSFFPELTNNNMRGQGTKLYYDPKDPETVQNINYILPPGYLERVTMSEQTKMQYLTACAAFANYQGDEIFLYASTGKLYDFSIETPPVPEGTYEIRFGYLTNGKRGVAQLYIDNIPAGVPLNLNPNGTDVSIGWQAVSTTDPNGFENDKMMRNLGYMKAPASFKAADSRWYSTAAASARGSNQVLRKILGTYEFHEAGHHVLTVKGLSPGEFMFDYLEFIPTSALESEDIY